MKRELENQLWEKFYAGLTTPDEERALFEHPAAPDDAPQRTASRITAGVMSSAISAFSTI